MKSKICEVLGYPIPKSFKKTQPRFPGQNFDVLIQKSTNVQIWNESLDSNRRYILIQISEDDKIINLKIITGDILAKYDTTGKLTSKYQATMKSYGMSMLLSEKDTETIVDLTGDKINLKVLNPNYDPKENSIITIENIFKLLQPLVGKTVDYIGAVQERNRGAELHEMICRSLGYSNYSDDGTYPDIRNQLLEIKLQTSPTIDLGLHSPEDNEVIMTIKNKEIMSQDIRYAIFEGEDIGGMIQLKHLYVVSGCDFTKHFPLFKNGGRNSKIQIPLPKDFFFEK